VTRMYSMASPTSLGILWMKVWSPTVVRLNAEKPHSINLALRQSEAQWVSQPWKAASSDIACSLICIQIRRTKHIIQCAMLWCLVSQYTLSPSLSQHCHPCVPLSLPVYPSEGSLSPYPRCLATLAVEVPKLWGFTGDAT